MNPAPADRASIGDIARALAAFTAVLLLLTAPALLGYASLGADIVLDQDPLYRTTAAVVLAPSNDPTPAVVDLPRDLAIARQLHAGRLAHWNPFSACGAPLWAEQGGPFFPLKLPFYALASPAGYKLFLCLRLLAAALGAYVLARVRGLAHWPAVAAGATFELSGPLMESFAFGPMSAPYVLPWLLAGAQAIARRPSARAAGLTALAIGIAVAGGHPTMNLVALTGFAAAGAAHLVAGWRAPRRTAAVAAWYGAALALGLALAAPSWFPLVELNANGLSYKSTTFGRIWWANTLIQSRTTVPLAFFAPHVLQSLRSELVLAVQAAAPALGVLALALAAAGVVTAGLDLALVAVLATGIVLTTAPGWLKAVYALPGAHAITPYYAWVLVALPLTQALGAAIQGLDRAAGRRALLAGGALVAVGTLSLFVVRDVPNFYGPGILISLVRTRLATMPGLAAFAVPFIVAAIAIGLACRAPAHAARGAVLLGALAVGEQLALWMGVVQTPPARALRDAPSPAVAFLRRHLDAQGRLLGQPDLTAYPISSTLFGLADVRGMSGMPIHRYVDYLRAVDAKAVGPVVQSVQSLRSPLLDLAAVRYIAVTHGGAAPPAPLLAGDPRQPLAYADDYVAIYENRAALPRVRIVHGAVTAADRGDALARLHAAAGEAAHADGTALAAAAVVEPARDGSLPPPLGGAAAGPDETVQVLAGDDHDRLTIDARLREPGLLVVADTYYPGWRATVDGVATPIYPTNVAFRSVFVPAGAHRIELRYVPRAFRLGLVVAAMAALVSALLAWRAPQPVPQPLTPPAPLSTGGRSEG